MQHITIRHRDTDAVLYELDVPDDDQYPMRTALMTAIRAGREPEQLRVEAAAINAALVDGPQNARHETALKSISSIIERELATPTTTVNLDRAIVRNADLRCSRFVDSSFVGSRFDDSSFDGSSFVGSRFVDSSFDGSSFDGSSFDGSSFERCTGAVPVATASIPEQSPAERDAALAERRRARALRYRAAHPDVPVIERIDAKTLAAVESDPHALDMRQWHCGSTHCRGGFAVHHAGDVGRTLERQFGTAFAAQKIYLASAGFVPNFSGNTPNDVALADIREAARIHELAFPTETAQS